MIEKVRRVVTGESETGAPVFALVEEVEPERAAIDHFGMWGWESMPDLPLAPAHGYTHRSSFPEAGGVRALVVRFPPVGEDGARLDPATPAEEEAFQRVWTVVDAYHEHDHATGMHNTNSIEIGYVIEGEIVLRQDGDEVTLRPGDCIVQNGARHAWSNRTAEPCLVGFVIMGATREAEPAPAA